jgi:hypothetical protein
LEQAAFQMGGFLPIQDVEGCHIETESDDFTVFRGWTIHHALASVPPPTGGEAWVFDKNRGWKFCAGFGMA